MEDLAKMIKLEKGNLEKENKSFTDQFRRKVIVKQKVFEEKNCKDKERV